MVLLDGHLAFRRITPRAGVFGKMYIGVAVFYHIRRTQDRERRAAKAPAEAALPGQRWHRLSVLWALNHRQLRADLSSDFSPGLWLVSVRSGRCKILCKASVELYVKQVNCSGRNWGAN